MPRIISTALLILSSVSLAAFASLLYQKPPHDAVIFEAAATTSPAAALDAKPVPALPAAPKQTVSHTIIAAKAALPAAVESDAPTTIATMRVEDPAGTRAYAIFREGQPLIEAMRTLAGEGLLFVVREYPGMGAFVESIGGVKNADGYYWILWVNGAKAAAGASSVIVHEGDQFRWVYEQGY